jgi:dienelactone hydrolase
VTRGVRTRRVYLTGAAIGLALLGVALRYGAALGLTLALAAPSLDAWLGGRSAGPVGAEVTVPAGGRQLLADLYRPAAPRGALLLVHGLSRAGRRHPELVRLARLLSRHGQLVLVPQLDGLAAFRLGGREVEEIGAALGYLRAAGHRPAVAGFSFGAGPALLAAAREPDLRLAASFGGYADLRHVIEYVTTGVHRLGGHRYTARQEEYNRWKLLALLAAFADDARDRALLGEIAERKLANPAVETGALERELGAGGGAVLAVAVNRRDEAVAALLAGLPSSARDALDRLSPLAAVPHLSGRLLVAHGIEDDSIPFTESLRLADAAGGRARLALLRGFHHTGPRSWWGSLADHARDGVALVALVDDLLAP